MHWISEQRIHKRFKWDNPALRIYVCVWERDTVKEWGDTGRERDRMQCVSLNMGWNERKRERAHTTEALVSDSLQNILKIQELYSISFKPATLSLFLSEVAPPPFLSLWSPAFPSSLTLSSTLCLHLSLSPFYVRACLAAFFHRKLVERSQDMFRAKFEPGSLWAITSKANAPPFAARLRLALPFVLAFHPHVLSLSKLSFHHILVFITTVFLYQSPSPCSQIGDLWALLSLPLFHLRSLSFSSSPLLLPRVRSLLLSRVQRRKIGLAGSVSI